MEFDIGIRERKSNEDEDEDSLRGCTRGFYSVDKIREESKCILVTSDPRNSVKYSLGRLLPKPPRQMTRTLDIHSTLLIAALSP